MVQCATRTSKAHSVSSTNSSSPILPVVAQLEVVSSGTAYSHHLGNTGASIPLAPNYLFFFVSEELSTFRKKVRNSLLLHKSS